MGLFKRLCSVFTSSVEDAMSELSKQTPNTSNTTNTGNTNHINQAQTNPPTVNTNTYATDNNSDDMINKYVFNGEVRVGTQITVNPNEMLAIIKDGVIVNLLPTGVYFLDDSNVFDFANGFAYTINLKESNKIRWGTTNPISFNDNKYGMLSLRARGAYSYRICDVVKFVNDYMNSASAISVNDYTKNLLINAVETAIYECNSSSYTQIPTAEICKIVENNLMNTGLSFAVNLEMITLTEKSQAIIKQAKQNEIMNNL